MYTTIVILIEAIEKTKKQKNDIMLVLYAV